MKAQTRLAENQERAAAPQAVPALEQVEAEPAVAPRLVSGVRDARFGLTALLLGGLGLLIAGQLGFTRDVGFERAGWLQVLGGLSLFLMAPIVAQRPALAAHPATRRLALGLAALLASVSAAALAGQQALMAHPLLAMLAWGAGIALGLAACARRDGPLVHDAAYPAWSRAELLGLAALCLIAFVLRVVDTGRLPALTSDEAATGLSAVDILEGRLRNPFVMGWYSFPALFFALPAAMIALFGQNFEALRLPAALGGALTVSGVYWLARPLFGRAAATYAAVLLTGLNFHLHFSRIGLNNIWDGVFATFILGCFWRGWQRQHRTPFLVAGLLLGLSQYFYTGTRLIPLVLLAWITLSTLFDWRATARRLGHLAAMALMAALVVLPLALFYVEHPQEFRAPTSRVSLLHDPDGNGNWFERTSRETGTPIWRLVLNNYRDSASAFTATPMRHWYQSGYPMLLAVPAALFLAGLAIMLVQPGDARHWLLLIWLAGVVSIGALTESTPAAQRYVGGAALAVIVAGMGLAWIATQLGKLVPDAWLAGMLRRGPLKQMRLASWLLPASRLTYGAALVLALVAATNEARFYFFSYGRERTFGDNGMQLAAALGRELESYPPASLVYFFGPPVMGYRTQETITFLAPQVIGQDVPSPPETSEWPLAVGQTAFVFLPHREGEAQPIQRRYPGGELQRFTNHQGEPLFLLYRLP
jgi:4-amino-4-deoxy-L-arabinose transferase-like glycosyltransferase